MYVVIMVVNDLCIMYMYMKEIYTVVVPFGNNGELLGGYAKYAHTLYISVATYHYCLLTAKI